MQHCKQQQQKQHRILRINQLRNPFCLLLLSAHLCLSFTHFDTQTIDDGFLQFARAFEDQDHTGVASQNLRLQSLAQVVDQAERGYYHLISRDDDTTNLRVLTRRFADANENLAGNVNSTLFIQATAIHVDRAEFPLSKLVFKLTLKLALEQVERSLARRRVKILLNLRSASSCTNQYAGALAAEEYYTRRTRLLIISGCDDAIKSVSRLASVWQIPLMTAAGFSADFNEKRTHRTLTRVAFSLTTAVEFLVKIMNSYRWSRFNLIVDESDPNSPALREIIESHIVELEQQQQASTPVDQHANLNILSFDLASLLQPQIDHNTRTTNDTQSSDYDVDSWPNEITRRAIGDILRQASLFSRVNVVLIPQAHLRRFMLSVHDQGMANGQYTFITIPLLLETTDGASQFNGVTSSPDNQYVWRSLTSKRNSQAKQAYESLMSIYVKTPTSKQYNFFARNLTDLANSAYVINPATSSRAANKSLVATTATRSRGEKRIQVDVNPYSAAFYDCLQIYAKALNESLGIIETQPEVSRRRELRRSLHANITNFMRDKKYENMLTGTIYLNKNGDRETDYSLDDMNQMGKFWPVIWFNGQSRLIERLAPIRWSADQSVGPTDDDVECHLTNSCSRKALSKLTISLIIIGLLFGSFISVIIIYVYRHLSLESQLVDYWWKIRISEIEILNSRRKQAADGSSNADGSGSAFGGEPGGGGHATNSVASSNNISSKAQSTLAGKVSSITRSTNVSSAADATYGNILLGNYKLGKVALKPIVKFHQSRKLMLELKLIKPISHNNLNRFIGIITEEPNSIVTEFCPKGSLREFFQNESIVIDWTFKYSIINDVMSGLSFLHSSPLEFHGRLKSGNCLVSSRFVVKLSDYGLGSLFDHIDQNESDMQLLRKCLWRAPEHLRSSGKKASKKGDVYSLGLLLYEITTNRLPFFVQEKDDFILPLKTLVEELKSNGPTSKTGPDLSSINLEETPHIQTLVNIIKSCIQWDPKERLSLGAAHSALKKLTHGVTSKKLLQNLTDRMEQYTSNLESMVDGKLATLIEEKQKAEELLYQFVPKSIAPLLKEGQAVEPEAFDCVTVFFSDIVGFTSLSSESTPMQVIDFLSELYLCFDEILDQYDCFKIDIVGDAYIVASGVPQRNEGRHIIEIARAALSLRERLRTFKIPHKPGRALEMRVGIHSGPCVGGIVGGVNMPKYCVFGETLSMGKYMESSGLPMKIHITEDSKNMLDSIGGFTIEARLPKISKDGFQIQTYWLNGELQAS